jgi:hypothetical protein
VQIVFNCKYSILCTYLGERPHFILKHHFVVIIVFDVTWYHFVLRVVVCNIPRFYQILGEFFCFCFASID